MMFRRWPPQYFWAMMGSGGGGGGNTRITVTATTPEPVDVVTPTKVWTHSNDTDYPMFVQTFDSDGDEMRTDVTG